MSELAATGGILLIGAMICLPTLPAIGRWGYAALIVPAGFAGYLVAGTALVALGAFSSGAALVAASIAALLIALGWGVRSAGARTLRWVDAVTAMAVVGGSTALLTAVFRVADLTRLSPDSVEYLVVAGALERVGSLDPIGPAAVVARLIGAPLLHAPGVGEAGYMPSWTPLLGAGGVALTSWLAYRALAIVGTPMRWRAWILGSALVLLVTTNRVLFNLFYINAHMAFATFLLLGVGGAWYATVSDRSWVLVPAALGFATLPVLRPEGVIVALLFLVPLVASERVSLSGRWVLIVPVVTVSALWYGFVAAPRANPDMMTITGPVIGSLIGMAMLVFLVALSGVRRIRRLMPMAVVAMPIVIGAFLAVRSLGDLNALGLALSAMGANLAYNGLWSSFWYVTPAIFVAAAVVVRVPLQRVLVYPLATWPLAILLFAFLRGSDGYRVGTGDSGNRMMMHVALVLVLYLVTAAGVAARIAESEPPLEAAAVRFENAGVPVRSGGRTLDGSET